MSPWLVFHISRIKTTEASVIWGPRKKEDTRHTHTKHDDVYSNDLCALSACVRIFFLVCKSKAI